MNEFKSTLATAGKRDIVAVASEPVTGSTLLEATYGGKVAFHKVRETGTLRKWPVYAPGSKERKHAETLRTKVEKSTVAAVAKAENVSVATLRRTLVSLAFTEGLEAMTAKERTALAKEATENAKVAPKPEPKQEAKKSEPKAPAKPASKPAPRKPSGKQAQAKAHAAKMAEEAASTVAAAKAAK